MYALTKCPVGYFLHKKLIPNFDGSSMIDQSCAVSSGIAWTAYGFECISTEACCLTAACAITFNSHKVILREFSNSIFDAPYNKQKSLSEIK